MKYRAEIDGLRAVAVISVILFHAGFEHLSGGFIGVDIFFVISGYLITTIILSEKEQGAFSLVNFYDRRARRILPALFLVMLVSLPFAWFWLLPSDMNDFSRSLVAISFFASNILFWQETGYWGVENELKPLLHTWSLAVEEQYYFIFPIFLMLMWKFRKRWILSSFIVISIFSLMLSQWAAYNYPIANFFLLLTRGWELAIGACIAFYFLYRKNTVNTLLSNKFIDEVMGTVGLALIGFSIFVFDESTPFPSFFALFPTIGTGLIILFSSQSTMVGRLLSIKILVSIGLLSYSAYLWHQPIFAFARHRILTEPSQSLFAALIVMTFFLAYLSWRYVEKPFRNKSKISKKYIFLFSLIGTSVFIIVGLMGQATNGFESRYSDNAEALLYYQKYEIKWLYRKGSCFLEIEQTYSDFKDECFSSVNSNNSIILWGDSHSAALSYGLRKALPNLTQLTAGGCTPLKEFDPIVSPNCIDINNYILKKIAELKPKLLFLHANWIYSLDKNKTGLKESLSHTVSYIKSVSPKTNIIIIGGVPQWSPSLPTILLKSKIELNEMVYVYSHRYKEIQSTDQVLSMVANENKLSFISLLDIFCKNEKCLSSVKIGNRYEPFTWDYGHLTKLSSSLIAEKILLTINPSRVNVKIKP